MKDLYARPARLDFDAERLRAWRNDPGTLRYSVVTRPVGATEHAMWLDRVLRDPTRHLMIVHHRAGGDGPVGTYRLDPVGANQFEVSVTVAPEWRGRRLATPLIDMATEHAVRLGALRVLATIHAENEASRRAFTAAGYVLEDGKDYAGFESYACEWRQVAGRLCALCRRGVPHHTNSSYSIAGGDRSEVWDIHAVDDPGGVGLKECEAGDLLLAWSRSRASTELGARGRLAVECERGRSTRSASTTQWCRWRIAIDTETFMKNPVVFDYHSTARVIGRVKWIDRREGYLEFDLEFDPNVVLPAGVLDT